QADPDAFALDDVANRVRHVLVLVLDEARSFLADSHLASEAAEHLSKLQSDIAATDDNQVTGQEIDFHHGAVGEVIDLIEARHPRGQRTAPDVQKDTWRAQAFGTDAELAGRFKTGVALEHGAVLHVLEPAFYTGPRLAGKGVLARFDLLHVHG